jgi:hypothetical protein
VEESSCLGGFEALGQEDCGVWRFANLVLGERVHET